MSENFVMNVGRDISLNTHRTLTDGDDINVFLDFFPNLGGVSAPIAFEFRREIAHAIHESGSIPALCEFLYDTNEKDDITGTSGLKIRKSIKNIGWSGLLFACGMRPQFRSSQGDLCKPARTIVLEQGVKELQFVHVYFVKNFSFSLIYGAIRGDLLGFVITSRHSDRPSSTAFSYSQKFSATPVFKRLLAYLESAPKLEASAQDKVSLMTGAMVNNFGHTVLNHCSIISLLKNTDLSGAVDKIYIGNSDFLEFSSIIREPYKTEAMSLHYEDAFGGFILDGTVLPVATTLPSRSSLDILMQFASDGVAPAAAQGPALLLVLDNRKGRRSCQNTDAIIRAVCDEVKRHGDATTIVIDGLTAVPRFDGKAWQMRAFHGIDADALAAQMKAAGIDQDRLVILDGLSLREKLRLCARYAFLGCVAPLGSSLMFPIYFLNIGVVGFGESRMAGLMEGAWEWHVGMGCHARRTESLHIARPSREGPDGYETDISELVRLLKKVLETTACGHLAD